MGIADVTENLKTAIEAVNMYNGTETKGTATVELERLINSIDGRYPYIIILGPYVEGVTDKYRVFHGDIEYEIRYLVNKNDNSENPDTEISYLTRNVNADIIRGIMLDPTRGGNAINTVVKEKGYDFDIVSGDAFNKVESDIEEFSRYVIISVTGQWDADDIALIG